MFNALGVSLNKVGPIDVDISHLGGSLLPAWHHGGKRGQWRLGEGGE